MSIDKTIKPRHIVFGRGLRNNNGVLEANPATMDPVRAFFADGIAGSETALVFTATDTASTDDNTQDGVTLVVDDRMVLNNGDATSGLYLVTTLADGIGQALVLTRTTDANDTSAPNVQLRPGSDVVVNEGTLYADTIVAITTDVDITIATTAHTWEQIGSVGVNKMTPEAHTVSAGEVTAGFLTLSTNPLFPKNVQVWDGPIMGTNKQLTPTDADFDILNTNELHINNNGSATGLTEHIIEGDVLQIFEN